MAWFFTDENITSDTYVISGENARHISKSLRMKKGEELTLVTPDNTQCECVLTEITAEYSAVKITEKRPCENEPDVFVTLYQALPKGDKMDYIVQKCVELGISRSFEKAAQMSLESEKQIIFYELGGEKVNKILDKKPKSIAMFIGSEGGFEQSEVDKIIANGGSPATLGKRILRAETAPLAALSIIMFQTDNF